MWKGTNDDTYHEMMNINYRKNCDLCTASK